MISTQYEPVYHLYFVIQFGKNYTHQVPAGWMADAKRHAVFTSYKIVFGL